MLKPGGKLAAWCYSFPDIEHHAEADRVFRDFRENVLGPHKTDVMSHCERQYRDIAPSAQEFGAVEWDTIPYRLETTVWHLVCPESVPAARYSSCHQYSGGSEKSAQNWIN